MRLRNIVLAVVLAPALALAFAPAAGAAESRRYIVVLKPAARAGAVSANHVDRFGVDVSQVYSHALKGYAAAMPTAVASRLESLDRVAFVQRDRVVRAVAQTVPTGVNRAEADLSPTAAIDGIDQRVNVDVAIIDTGIDLDHPDLNVNVAGGRNCVSPILPPEDGHGHGTHVAGTVGALDNGTGVVGVAPGARVWPVKVLSDGGVGLTSWVVCGIDYVASRASEIEVANMSLGGAGEDDGNCGNTIGDAQHQAICRAVNAGVTVVVAAGNDHQDSADSSPASYDEVITVSALADFNGQPGGGAAPTCRTDQDDTFADFSNYGADVDLIAPGVCILSTSMLGGYATLSGTSMASPHVAGGAALYASANPAATPAQVKGALQAAGTLNWTWPSQDPDGTQERLLNVAGF